MIRKWAERTVRESQHRRQGLVLHPEPLVEDHHLQGAAPRGAARGLLHELDDPSIGERAGAWCTSASAPTRSRPGSSRSRSARSRTTARSTPCAATPRGWARASSCSTGRDLRRRRASHPAHHHARAAVIPRMLDNTAELLLHAGRTLAARDDDARAGGLAERRADAGSTSATSTSTTRAWSSRGTARRRWRSRTASASAASSIATACAPRAGPVTKDGLVVLASETGVLDFPPENVERKGRLEPGRMFLVDTEKGRIVEDEEIKDEICRKKPVRSAGSARTRSRCPRSSASPPSRDAPRAPRRCSSARRCSATRKKTWAS